jgi:uncharacterized phage-associated protein
MRSNSVNCDVVADYFLLQVDLSAGDSITNLKLQKLCYYAQAWSLALHGKPLFPEAIEAWAHGPVVRGLYARFRSNTWQAIDPTALKTDPLARLSPSDIELLDTIWHRYGGLTGRQLERQTHSEAPWVDAYGDTPKGERCNKEITHEAMSAFYSAKLKHNAANSRARAT